MVGKASRSAERAKLNFGRDRAERDAARPRMMDPRLQLLLLGLTDKAPQVSSCKELLASPTARRLTFSGSNTNPAASIHC